MSTAPRNNDPLPPPPGIPQWVYWILYAFKEVGLSTALVVVIVYMLLGQLPSITNDFRMQTNKLVEAVSNNSEVMSKLSAEIQEMKIARREEAKQTQDLTILIKKLIEKN